MVRYITRHGQVANYISREGGHLYPPGDPPLSELGREQARRLGVHMRELGFRGHIICSPFMRTLETAECVARETGSLITPFAPIREIFQTQESADVFHGLTLEQIRRRYRCIDADTVLPYPWWCGTDGLPHRETFADVQARVNEGLAQLDKLFGDTDLLLVGHGASVGAMVSCLGIQRPAYGPQTIYNCSLSFLERRGSAEKQAYADISFLGYENTTSNFLFRQQEDAEYFARPWPCALPLPEDIRQIRGSKLLCIGNTHSLLYPYYRKLFEEVEPDMILHTGNLAAEVKAGLFPGTGYEYVSKIKVLLDAMRASGARLLLVPGSNDLPDEIRRLCPNVEICNSDTDMILDGIQIKVGRQVAFTLRDKDWDFYGHGPAGDMLPFNITEPGHFCGFDTDLGSFLFCLSEGKYFYIPEHTLRTDPGGN